MIHSINIEVNMMSDLLNSLTTELRRGTLPLAVLSQLDAPQYGYSLVQLLEKQELVTSSWDTTKSRPRKYYKISEFGIDIFNQLKAEWEKMNQELGLLLKRDEQNGAN